MRGVPTSCGDDEDCECERVVRAPEGSYRIEVPVSDTRSCDEDVDRECDPGDGSCVTENARVGAILDMVTTAFRDLMLGFLG